MNPKPPRITPDVRQFVLALLAGFPAVLTSLLFLWMALSRLDLQITFSVVIVAFWLGFSVLLRNRFIRYFQTISNLLGSLREGEYSIRGKGASKDDAFGLAILEVNSLASTLREERLRALEATALLKKVMAEMDVAVFAFDEKERLQLANRAAERLLGKEAKEVLQRSARALGLDECLRVDRPRTLEIDFPGESGRWEVHKSSFREGGRPHWLLVIANLNRALREGEQEAWRRLVRVLSHEINNSLAPIQSLAGTLQTTLDRQPGDWEKDLKRGLAVIQGRSEALARFMASYAKLARLPAPKIQPVDVETWVRRVTALEKRLEVSICPGEKVEVQADGDQLDQLLINLLGNAVDASLKTRGWVKVAWLKQDSSVEIRIDDEGPGITNPANLFVPFFTTKRKGTGIGLVLSRQIAENHGGILDLKNRADGQGCRARVTLPLRA